MDEELNKEEGKEVEKEFGEGGEGNDDLGENDDLLDDDSDKEDDLPEFDGSEEEEE